MKTNLLAFLLFSALASIATSQSAPVWGHEIKKLESELRPADDVSNDMPEKMMAETTVTFGISTPIAGVSIVPKVRFDWTKSESLENKK